MNNFMGKNGFVWWQGVVEDRHDPLYLGRCRVRILGWHTEDRGQMPSESLPWAYPVQPITSAAQTGVGISPTGPVEGTWVVGFFRDGEDAQEPVFFGTLGGIPAPLDNKVGFSDPRQTLADFDEHPFLQSATRVLDFGGGKVTDEQKVPRAPAKIKHYGQGTTANTANNYTSVELKPSGKIGTTDNVSDRYKIFIEEHTERQPYPDFINYEGEPTTPRAARGQFGNFPTTSPYSKYGLVAQKHEWMETLGAAKQAQKDTTEVWMEPDPAAMYGARYPYNHVHQSESGHLIEVDDTPGKERLHWYHRAGTFTEIGSLGQKVTKVANEDYDIKLMNAYERVVGSKYQSISGKLDIVSSSGYYHKIESGIFNMEVKGAASFDTSQFTVNAKDGVTINAGSGSITLTGHSLIQRFATSKKSQEVAGDSTVKVGGKYAIKSGSLNMSARGSAGISAGGGINLIASDNIQASCLNLAGLMGAPAFSVKSAIGKTIFETVAPGLDGAFEFNNGPKGVIGQIKMNAIGDLEMSATQGAIYKINAGATGIDLSYLAGVAKVSLSAAGIELSYGQGVSSIVVGPAGVTIKGPLITSTADGINTVKGSLVMLN